jgi:hypothetical protein
MKMNGFWMSVHHRNNAYQIGEFTALDIKTDQYFNITDLKFSGKADPIEEFLGVPYMWAYNVDRFHTDHGYCFRTTQALFIHYWRNFYKELSALDLLKMLEVALDLPTEGSIGHAYYGFYAWLMTSKYRGSDSGLLTGKYDEYRGWKSRSSFIELWDDRGSDLLANCNSTKDLRDAPLTLCGGNKEEQHGNEDSIPS